MNQNIINTAIKKLEKLQKNYNGLVNVLVDNWRGWRFVFDTEDVRQCQNRCDQCALYQLLKNEKEDYFSPGLFPASLEDKKLFGLQNFLNCKTIEQYKNCYVNFLVKKANSKKEIRDEIGLIMNARIVFSKQGNTKRLEKRFQQQVLKQALKLSGKEKQKSIKDAYKDWVTRKQKG